MLGYLSFGNQQRATEPDVSCDSTFGQTVLALPPYPLQMRRRIAFAAVTALPLLLLACHDDGPALSDRDFRANIDPYLPTENCKTGWITPPRFRLSPCFPRTSPAMVPGPSKRAPKRPSASRRRVRLCPRR